jgi:hypothetical protein
MAAKSTIFRRLTGAVAGEPIYETLERWQDSNAGARSWAKVT